MQGGSDRLAPSRRDLVLHQPPVTWGQQRLLTNRLKKRSSSARRIRFTEVPHVVEFRHVPTPALPLTSVGSVQNMITDERFSSSQNRA
jgi:hypothetical protein